MVVGPDSGVNAARGKLGSHDDPVGQLWREPVLDHFEKFGKDHSFHTSIPLLLLPVRLRLLIPSAYTASLLATLAGPERRVSSVCISLPARPPRAKHSWAPGPSTLAKEL